MQIPRASVADGPLDDLSARVLLALIPGVGPRLRRSLLSHFGTAGAILAATPRELRMAPGIGSKLCQTIVRASSEIDAAGEIEFCRQQNIQIITDGDPTYPSILREIPDPPGVLFTRGAFEERDALSIAIVGSRHATNYGLTQAERLAASLARGGFTIISGLARGIDAAAHRGALAAGGRTIAMLGGGLANIYPPEHKSLADEISQHGILASELPPRMLPMSGTFPQRNRLISGLSLGVIVVEAADRSGALITARHALEQGREVFAVPGRVDSRMSRGCHQLLRDGAKLVETDDDVLAELGPLHAAMPVSDDRELRHPAELSLNDTERKVLDAIDTSSTSIDEVIQSAALPTHQVLAAISALELRKLVRRLEGNQIQRL